jgi:hypothetical protein
MRKKLNQNLVGLLASCAVFLAAPLVGAPT